MALYLSQEPFKADSRKSRRIPLSSPTKCVALDSLIISVAALMVPCGISSTMGNSQGDTEQDQSHDYEGCEDCNQ